MQRTIISTFTIAFFVFVMACTQQADQESQREKTINPIAGPPVSQNEQLPDATHRVIQSDRDDKHSNTGSVSGRQMPAKELALRSAADALYQQSQAPAAQSMIRGLSMDEMRYPSEPLNRENYAHYDNNPVKRAIEQPVSTFGIDVDTGSYANVRRFLKSGTLPAQDAVRAEELINYFSYDYPLPQDPGAPFSLTHEIAPTPWNPDTLLLHIGIKGYEVSPEQLPAANLVFLVDVSGSMDDPNKLPLLVKSMKMLVDNLGVKDKVAIVTYAGNAGLVLPSTSALEKETINSALENLKAGGTTAGGEGIELAYKVEIGRASCRERV